MPSRQAHGSEKIRAIASHGFENALRRAYGGVSYFQFQALRVAFEGSFVFDFVPKGAFTTHFPLARPQIA
jgi:hypothetical protein